MSKWIMNPNQTNFKKYQFQRQKVSEKRIAYLKLLADKHLDGNTKTSWITYFLDGTFEPNNYEMDKIIERLKDYKNSKHYVGVFQPSIIQRKYGEKIKKLQDMEWNKRQEAAKDYKRYIEFNRKVKEND